MEARGFVIAGTHSGVGKTSLAIGIMGALVRRGHPVAPFKVGPDYIDPTYHAVACGRPSRNLDTWLMPASEAMAVFQRGVVALSRAETVSGDGRPSAAAERPPVAVVEGVMGLFDGLAGGGDRCSTAEMARLLHLPVILVVDASHMAGSVAALVHGFVAYDPSVRVAGVIVNKVAGASHAAMLRAALAGGVPVLGVVPRRDDLHLESRHLGLIPTVEDSAIGEVIARIVDHVEAHVDLETLCRIARPLTIAGHPESAAPCAGHPAPATHARCDDQAAPAAHAPRAGCAGHPAPAPLPARRVAVARDAAFSFYYQDNLDVLGEEGAELVFFSPLAGDGLPSCDALYLGGGYPEVYAAELAANCGLHEDLRRAAAEGLCIYAECGGYLYLGREIEYGSSRHPMVGLLPTRTTMAEKRLRLGYVEVEAADSHPLAGTAFRGHLFHYSTTTGSESPAYLVRHKDELLRDGWAGPGVVASYVHLHFRGSRALARWLASGGDRKGELHHA